MVIIILVHNSIKKCEFMPVFDQILVWIALCMDIGYMPRYVYLYTKLDGWTAHLAVFNIVLVSGATVD